METKNVGLCEKIGHYLVELEKWPTWQNILLGQFLSLLLCIQTILSHYMNKGTVGVLATGQTFPHYMLLCVIYTSWLACRSRNTGLIPVLKARGWRYFLLSLIDVQANTLLSASHQFTTIASIQLLGCVAIPVALVLTCLVLGVRYRMIHIVAVSVCLLGVGCLVWADVEDQKTNGKNHLMGDMLCLGGAVLATVVTVLQELSVKTTDVVEYLGLLGLFGTIVSGAQMMLLEKQTIFSNNLQNVLPYMFLGIYGTLQFIFFSLASLMIQNTSATALHLSLLSANYYTFVIGTLFLDYKVHALYFISYVLMMTGVFTFSIKSAPIAIHNNHDRQSTRSLIDRQAHQNSIASDGTVELLSNMGTVNLVSDNPILQHSHSTDTTFTSFYGSNVNFPQTNITNH
ncbi:hypothetical protein CBL_06982 [Carabus blaptoides fortunei]